MDLPPEGGGPGAGGGRRDRRGRGRIEQLPADPAAGDSDKGTLHGMYENIVRGNLLSNFLTIKECMRILLKGLNYLTF